MAMALHVSQRTSIEKLVKMLRASNAFAGIWLAQEMRILFR